MYKLTFDHNQQSTMSAILINDKYFRDWLFDEKQPDSEKNHLMSCLEVFMSHFDGRNFESLAKALHNTDFQFEIKLNMAWQIGLNIKNQDAEGIRQTIGITMMRFPKKSQWLEGMYKDENNPIEDLDARLLLIVVMHALVV